MQSEVSSGGAVDGVAHVVKFMGIQLRWGFSPPPLFSGSAKSKLSSHSFCHNPIFDHFILIIIIILFTEKNKKNDDGKIIIIMMEKQVK